MASGTTIVTCIEAGPLETQVLMLAESLRTFGGPWAKTDMVAVKPRRGPGIAAHTRRELKRLGVEFVDERLNVALDWWNNANKSAVMSQLESRLMTPYITWMDGDMVVLQDLDDLCPTDGAQFIARAGEGYLGSDGTDENAAYWHKLCALIGLDFDAFPMVVSFPERRRIHAYWQAGIYTYSTDTQLGRSHHEIITQLLSSNVGSRRAGIYHQDQVSISLAIQKLKLVHAEYDPRMNYNLSPLAKENARILSLRDVRILHYHNALYPEALSWAMEHIGELPQDRVELIDKYVPLTANATLLARVHKKILGTARQRRVDEFRKQAVLY